MSEELGLKILSNLRDHHKSGTAEMKEAADLAKELGQEEDQIRQELELLEQKGFVRLFKAFDSWGAIIEALGLDHLEQIED